MIDVTTGTEGATKWDSVLVCKVQTSTEHSDGSGSVRGLGACWRFSHHQNGKSGRGTNTEVLVLNSTSMLLLEAKEGSTKFKVRRKRMLHELDVSRGATAETLVVSRAGDEGDEGNGDDSTKRDEGRRRLPLVVQFLSSEEATRVYERTDKRRRKFQQAIDLLDFPGAEVARLEPRIYQLVVDDRIVARHPSNNEEILIKAVSRRSKLGFVGLSPMGVVSGHIGSKGLFSSDNASHTMLLHPEGGEDVGRNGAGEEKQDDSDGGDRFAVEVKFEARASRRRGVEFAATIAIVFLSYGIYELLQPEGNSAFVLLAAMLAVRVAVAAMHHDILVKITSCTVVEQSTSKMTPKRRGVAPFSRCLSVDHCLSLRRSLVDGLEFTDDQLESEMKAETLARLHEISPAINEDLFQRYVAACKGDVVKALSRLEDTAKWRRENNVDDILEANLPYFFPLKDHYVHALIGRTRDGLPIIVEGMGRFGKAVTAFRKEGILPDHADEIIKQFIFHMEYIFTVVDPSPYPAGMFVRIYDMMGISLRDVSDSEAVNLGYEMMTMLENHYCERMARAIVIAPPIFGTLWSMFRGLVDPATAEKIRIVSPRKLLPVLREIMDDDVIPRRWGGQGVNDWNESAMERDLAAWVRQRQT